MQVVGQWIGAFIKGCFLIESSIFGYCYEYYFQAEMVKV